MAMHRPLYGRWITILVAALGVVLCLIVQGATQRAFPPLTGRVVDAADLIPPAVESAISAKLAAHEQATGEQIVVVTIPSLGGENLERYTLDLSRHWGIGSKDKDDGVVFLVARDDRKLRIEVGYGLEGRLTDAATSIIIRHDIVPNFKSGNFTEGIERGVDQILRYLTATAEERSAWERQAEGDDDGIPWTVILFVALWCLIFFSAFLLPIMIRLFGKKIRPGHYRWLGMDAGPSVPRAKRRSDRGGWSGGSGWSGDGGWSGGGGGFSGGGGSFGGGGSSGSW